MTNFNLWLINVFDFFQIFNMPMKPDTSPNIVVDKAELRGRLTPVEYQVTQEKATERYVW